MSDNLVISCLDHINIRNLGAPNKSTVITKKLADHYFVACRLSIDVISEPVEQSQLTVIDSRHLDKLISAYNWDMLIETCNYQDAYSKLVDILSNFKNMSTKTIHIKRRRKNRPWVTTDVLSAIKEKDVLLARCRRFPDNKELRLQYQSQRNRVNALIRSRKRQHFHERFYRSRFDASKTWALVNEVKGCSAASIDDTIKKHFKSDVTSIADSFNRFFASVSGVSHDEAISPINLQLSCSASAFLPNMTMEDLRAIFFNFRPNKAPGSDSIRVGDIRRNFEVLGNVLLYILNGCISSGVIPVGFKNAIVRPLFKGGRFDDVKSYRPISILSCLSLALEKHILNTMTAFLDKFSLLSPSQYGFITGRGTQSLLEDLVDTLNTTLDKNKFACALFLDVSKAFDSISHKILLKKIYDCGFRGPFFSYS